MPKTITMIAGHHKVFSGSTPPEVFSEIMEWMVDINTDKRQRFTYTLTWFTMIRVDRNPDEGDFSDYYIAQTIFESERKEGG
jgi:hypothetical protein